MDYQPKGAGAMSPQGFQQLGNAEKTQLLLRYTQEIKETAKYPANFEAGNICSKGPQVKGICLFLFRE